MNNKLLMVAYLYPPHGGGGTQRTVKFAKYLPSFGIEPIILTSSDFRKKHADQSYLGADDHIVIRAQSPQINDKVARILEPFVQPDIQRLWVKSAIDKGLVAAYRHQVHAVYSTSMPYSNHIVGRAIAKKLSLPWIADFRDLWTSNALYEPRAPWAKYFHLKMEKSFYQDATHICCASPGQREIIIKKFKLEPNKVTAITNGFDPADFVDDKNNSNAHQSNEVNIGYLGSFYGKYRPSDFIEALRTINSKQPGLLDKVKFTFIGDMDRAARNLLQAPDLSQIIKYSGYVPHGQLNKIRKSMAGYFLYLPDLEGPMGATIPQKVFEYLATRKPIFAILPPGDAANILNKSGYLNVVRPGNPEIIARALTNFVNALKNGDLSDSNANLAEYTRKNLTGKLAQIINDQL